MVVGESPTQFSPRIVQHVLYFSLFRAARTIGSYSAGFLILRRAWVLPEQHWWVTCPIGTFMLASTMLADVVWPAVRWSVVQKGAGERMTVLVGHMGLQAVETKEKKKG